MGIQSRCTLSTPQQAFWSLNLCLAPRSCLKMHSLNICIGRALRNYTSSFSLKYPICDSKSDWLKDEWRNIFLKALFMPRKFGALAVLVHPPRLKQFMGVGAQILIIGCYISLWEGVSLIFQEICPLTLRTINRQLHYFSWQCKICSIWSKSHFLVFTQF